MSDFTSSFTGAPAAAVSLAAVDPSPRSPRDRDRPVGHGSAAASAPNALPEDRARSPTSSSAVAASGGAAARPDLPPSHRSNSGAGAASGNNSRHPVNPDHVTLRSLVSTKEAGVIIGKQGANIKAIREESNARVMVSEHVPGVQERVVSITGAVEEVAKAYAQVSRNLNQGDLRGNTPDAVESTPLTVRYLIPHSRMGAVIGKAGARIKEIQEESNARLVATSTPLPNSQDRVLEMIGVPDAIHIATYHMLVTIKDQADRPCPDRPYRPEYSLHMPPGAANGGHHGGHGGHHHQGAGGMHHGGGGHHQQSHGGGHYSGSGGMGGGSHYSGAGGGSHYSGSGMGGGGYGHHGSHMGGSGGGAPMHGGYHGGNTMGGGGGGYGQSNGPMMGGHSGNGGSGPGAGGPQETRTFYCPAAKVGPMIGKGGNRINRVRMETGCKISIEDARDARGDRPFVITGNPRDVDQAMRILESSLRREFLRDQERAQQGAAAMATSGGAAAAASGLPSAGPSPPAN
ncbi:PAB1 binding protein [Blastocladiella emersonii ATCC 22665]|nr:PAB1 binding protein [Blastocladiella emersonii ATCC 22665]